MESLAQLFIFLAVECFGLSLVSLVKEELSYSSNQPLVLCMFC